MTHPELHRSFEDAAAAAGWALDISPATEMSGEIWWRHQATFQLKRDETLRDELNYEQAQ